MSEYDEFRETGEMVSGRAATIAGGWLGTYHYGAETRQQSVRFEATFAESLEGRGRFTGTILDDEPPGEADVNGTQTGRAVLFAKVYRPDSAYDAPPIAYEGTLSEDGDRVTGTWSLQSPGTRSRRARLTGTWEARRLWADESDAESDFDSNDEHQLMLIPMSGAAR